MKTILTILLLINIIASLHYIITVKRLGKFKNYDWIVIFSMLFFGIIFYIYGFLKQIKR